MGSGIIYLIATVLFGALITLIIWGVAREEILPKSASQSQKVGYFITTMWFGVIITVAIGYIIWLIITASVLK